MDTNPFSVSYRQQNGTAEPAPPASQDFWSAQASGSGTQTISWPIAEGKWSVVAMNTDGSRSVSVDARLGARVGSLGWAAVGLLAGGGLVLLIGGGLFYLGVRQPRPSPRTAEMTNVSKKSGHVARLAAHAKAYGERVITIFDRAPLQGRYRLSASPLPQAPR